MAKRKVFTKTDLGTPQVEHVRDPQGQIVIPFNVIPPATTLVAFGHNATTKRSFNFNLWYGLGIDAVTYACQRQIERFLDKQDAEVEVSTVVNYCYVGLSSFLKYLSMRSTAMRRDIHLADITRDVVDGYLGFLRDSGAATTGQKTRYVDSSAKLSQCSR